MMVAYAKTANEVIDVLASEVIRPIELVLFALATVIFLWGVIEFIAHPDNEDTKTIGKRHMLWGLIGLAIMFGVTGIINVLTSFVAQIK